VSQRKSKSRTGDQELVAGSLAHYEDAAYYTSTYRRRIDDVQFYVSLANKAGGEVLEYGVGNGRVAMPVARHGVKVTGIDHSQSMLDDFRERLNAEPIAVQRRVTLQQGDMRTARVKKKFTLVTCPFNAALHLYTRQDVEQFLARVREHLKPNGKFVLDISIPAIDDLTRDPNKAYTAPKFKHPSAGMVRYTEHFDYDPIRQVLFVSMEFHPVDKKIPEFSTPLAHRQFYPQEWEALLHYNGFEVDQVQGDFHGGSLTKTSDTMVWHAKLRRGFDA
jgi:SAM-dependent methyltransferase